MSNYVVVNGCTLLASPPGSVMITSMPSMTKTVQGKGIYIDKLSVSLSGCTTSGAAKGEGSGDITATSMMTIDGKKIVRNTDTVTIIVSGQTTSTPPTSTTWSVTVSIINPGQMIYKSS